MATATVTIAANDGYGGIAENAPVAFFAPNSSSVSVNESDGVAKLTVQLDKSTPVPINVTYTPTVAGLLVSPTTATPGVDFVDTPSKLTFAVGEKFKVGGFGTHRTAGPQGSKGMWCKCSVEPAPSMLQGNCPGWFRRQAAECPVGTRAQPAKL